MTEETTERPSYSDDYEGWLAEYAPEYLKATGGKKGVESPPKPPGHSGPWITKGRTVPEMQPWSWWSQLIDPAGVIFVYDPERPADPPWTRSVLDKPFRAAMDKSNYFRNGGKTPIGGEGLDPSKLVGAYLRENEEGEDIASGPQGTYTFQYGTGDNAVEATFDDEYVADRLSNPNNFGPVPYNSNLHLTLVGDNQYRFGADPPEEE